MADHKQRLNEVVQTLRAVRDAWPLVLVEIESRIGELTDSLVAQNNEETRGRIKAYRELRDLPEALINERDGLIAALSDEDAAPE